MGQGEASRSPYWLNSIAHGRRLATGMGVMPQGVASVLAHTHPNARNTSTASRSVLQKTNGGSNNANWDDHRYRTMTDPQRHYPNALSLAHSSLVALTLGCPPDLVQIGRCRPCVPPVAHSSLPRLSRSVRCPPQCSHGHVMNVLEISGQAVMPRSLECSFRSARS